MKTEILWRKLEIYFILLNGVNTWNFISIYTNLMLLLLQLLLKIKIMKINLMLKYAFLLSRRVITLLFL